MLPWITNVEKRLVKSKASLKNLENTNPKYTKALFEQQWQRQKQVQNNVISSTTRRLKERMGVLLDLEEELIEARSVFYATFKL